MQLAIWYGLYKICVLFNKLLALNLNPLLACDDFVFKECAFSRHVYKMDHGQKTEYW